ncbi:MAG: alpha-galactosidase [Saprospiraceae bacterium]|nr:alpha-galactosidase [Lewinella sp.]
MRFLWNDGHILLRHLQDLTGTVALDLPSDRPFFQLPGLEGIENARMEAISVGAGARPAHLRVIIGGTSGSLQLRQIFDLYPESPLIAYHVALQGQAPPEWIDVVTPESTAHNDGVDRITRQDEPATLANFSLPSRHWQYQVIKLNDDTDWNNNLVGKSLFLPFTKPLEMSGNICFARNTLGDQQLILLKESPLGDRQLAYPGFDFLSLTDQLSVTGLGVHPADIQTDQWITSYTVAIGPAPSGELAALKALRAYQKKSRTFHSEYNMIMANTWGDRGRDGRVQEDFILRELEAGKRLGITHFQIDDGWQQGLSKNSASTAGKLWEDWDADSWQPHRERFPNGLEPIISRAAKLGIGIGLWFHPSSANSYGKWEQDADILISLYRQYGIKTFKIDGIDIPDKQAEVNLRRFYDKVTSATDGQVRFNVDVTAGRRGGYFFLTEYGNIFLENRYTDFANYYPHLTLRNLWQLSAYVPPELLQIELLNKWRNADRYGKDALAPEQYSFAYLFAVASMAQPLVWLELMNLPEAAFGISPMVARYRNIMGALHEGAIFPIGDMPGGKSWTGFQSILNAREGYFLIFREVNQQPTTDVQTWLTPGQKVRGRLVFGSGQDFTSMVQKDGRVSFTLAAPLSFALYHYELIPLDD